MSLSQYELDLKDVYTSESGKRLLARWKKMYVDSSAYDESPHRTAYLLGAKEFVQDILKTLERVKDGEQ